MNERDIVIIGAGVFGAATAYALAQRGLGERVLVLERGQPGCGSTGRSAALLTQVRDNPLQVALAQETFATLGQLASAYGASFGRHTVGALHVVGPAACRTWGVESENRPQREQFAPGSPPHSPAMGPEDGAKWAAAVDLQPTIPRSDRLPSAHASLQARLEHCARLGVPGQWLEAQEARSYAARLAPWLNPQSFDAAAFFPNEGYVDPHLLTTAYLDAARQHGARLQPHSAVEQIEHDGTAVHGLTLSDGRHLAASVVINATGVWANRLSLGTGLPLPMAPVRSQYWITAHDETLFPRQGCIVLIPELRVYTRPEVGAMLFGLRDVPPAVADARTLPEDLSGFVFDPSDPQGWNALAAGAPALQPHFPALDSTPMAHYIQCPSNYTDDGQLIVGPHPSLSGLYVASGCNGSGVSFSGGVGRLVAEMVCGAAPFLPVAAMAPGRRGDFDPYAQWFLDACAATRARKIAA